MSAMKRLYPALAMLFVVAVGGLMLVTYQVNRFMASPLSVPDGGIDHAFLLAKILYVFSEVVDDGAATLVRMPIAVRPKSASRSDGNIAGLRHAV